MGYLRHIAQTQSTAGNKLAASDLPAKTLTDTRDPRSVLLGRLVDLARCW